MKLITAILQPDKLDEVREALIAAGITRITADRVSGHGRPGNHEGGAPWCGESRRRQNLCDRPGEVLSHQHRRVWEHTGVVSDPGMLPHSRVYTIHVDT